MKIVINATYGAYIVPDYVRDALQCRVWDSSLAVRTSEAFLTYVREHPEDDFAIAIIPDDATDFMIQEYDGSETVYYVQDGKIHEADWEGEEIL